MQHTTNYNLSKFDATDLLEDTTRLGLNNNFDTIDTALKDATENGGIAVQDTEPTNNVLAWVDSDALGADFCFVGDTAPTTDGSVAVWVDTSEDEIPVQAGAEGVNYDNTDSGLTADNVQGAIDELSIYSTTETVVGTWIDGKPIYRMVFVASNFDTSGTTIGTITNFKELINMGGSAKPSNFGQWYGVHNIHTNIGQYYVNTLVNTNGNVEVRFGAAFTELTTVNVIVDYTKTTD